MRLSQLLENMQVAVQQKGDCEATFATIGTDTIKVQQVNVKVTKILVTLYEMEPGNASPQQP